ncbi:GntR family transcriptional regulator [Pseudoruegeria sp. HB172150]|uniref:GntR family transcriptional regulator n=1 Tax=Pseudoruegeria sp. HB172150 TaxID=2721164 RepID=UPI001553A8C3
MPEDQETTAAAGRSPSSEVIAQALKDRVLSGGYAPGQRLIEMELAEEFGVGRGRVREAFRTLVGEGLLAFVANRGVMVRRFTREEMLSIGRTREVLEGLAARLAAERELTAEEQAALSDCQARMDRAVAADDVEEFNRENRSYHALIAQFAGNELILDFLDRARVPLMRLQLPPGAAAESMPRSNRHHHAITTAILTGMPDAAEAAMRAHVRRGNQHIAELPDEDFQ